MRCRVGRVGYRVLDGPANCGTKQGYYKYGLVPKGKYAIVEEIKYNNGGFGPATVDGWMYSTKEEALKEARRLWDSLRP